MPCTMPTIYFDRSKQNNELKALGDFLTHELDMIREAILNGETPDFSAFDPAWSKTVEDARKSYRDESRGPSEGVLTNGKLLDSVEALLTEYQMIKHEWRKDRCEAIRGMLTEGQIKHRQEDIKRLMHTFVESGDVVRLKALLDVDPAQPLAPQLGYDPDEF